MKKTALMLVAAGTSTNAQRTTVPLDFGWRTALATVPTACPSYSIEVSGHYLGNSGWVNEAGSASEAACEAAACKHNTQAWSYCAPGLACPSPDNNHEGKVGPWCVIGLSLIHI